MSLIFVFLLWLVSALTIGALAAVSFQKSIVITWMDPLLPAYRNILRASALLLLACSIICVKLPPWFSDSFQSEDTQSFHHFWWNPWFYLVRSFVYLGILEVLIFTYRRLPQGFGFAYLIVLLLTGSFAAFDWIGVVHPDWHSTGFGLVCLSSAALFTLAVATLFSGASSSQWHKINNVHWALLCSWAYLEFTQFLIIWSGNKPEEAAWYLHKDNLMIVIGIQFTIGFLSFLFSKLKRSALMTKFLGLNTTLMQLLFIWWMVGGRK